VPTTIITTQKAETERMPQMLMDGRAWAYKRREGGGVGAKFYLPEENWPTGGPCLFCFSRNHV